MDEIVMMAGEGHYFHRRKCAEFESASVMAVWQDQRVAGGGWVRSDSSVAKLLNCRHRDMVGLAAAGLNGWWSGPHRAWPG